VVAAARAAYRSDPGVALLTSEPAWVADALREAGIAPDGEVHMTNK
jgi:hypothetical protein